MGEPRRIVRRWPRWPREHGLVLAAQALVVCLLALLVGRLWYLQVPMGEYYRALAGANRGETVSGDLEQPLDATAGRRDSSGAVLGIAKGEQPVAAGDFAPVPEPARYWGSGLYPHDEALSAHFSLLHEDRTVLRPVHE